MRAPKPKKQLKLKMKNIILKIILIQFIGCVFLIQGIQNLYFYTQNEKFECYLKFFDKQKSECFQNLNLTKEVGEFISNIYLWFFYWLFNRNIYNWIDKLEKKKAYFKYSFNYNSIIFSFPIWFF